MNMNLNAVNRQPTFQLQNGQLDVQAKQFIKQFDTDLDGSLSQAEVAKSSGLMGAVQTKVTSPQLAQALWASIAGPSNTINAKEYAYLLLMVDDDQNGMITQAEADDYITMRAGTFQSMGVKEGVQGIYKALALGGDPFGLDKVFGTTEEEQLAMGGIKPQGLQSVSAPESSLVNPKTQLMGLLTEEPDAFVGAEWKVQMILLAQLQIANTIGALLTLAADLVPNSPQQNSMMQRLDELQKLESSLKKEEAIASILPQQIIAELSKQGITIKRSQELVEIGEKIGAMFSLVAEEEPESPRYNALMAQVNKLSSDEYTLFKKLNPDYVRVVQEVSNKNKADILSGKINAENLPEVEKDTVTTVDGILTIPTLSPSTTTLVSDDIDLPLL
jgi:hypothetical protein